MLSLRWYLASPCMAPTGKADGGMTAWWNNSLDPKHPGPEWVGTADAIKWTGCTEETLRRWAREGHVESILVYRRRFYLAAGLPHYTAKPVWEVAKNPRAGS